MGRKKKRELTFKNMQPIYHKMEKCVAYYEGKYQVPEAIMGAWVKRLIDKGYHQIAMDIYRKLSSKYNFWKDFNN